MDTIWLGLQSTEDLLAWATDACRDGFDDDLPSPAMLTRSDKLIQLLLIIDFLFNKLRPSL